MLPFTFLSRSSAAQTPAAAAAALPTAMLSVMHKPRYAHAFWNLLVTDLTTGKPVYALAPDRLAFTGSVRKLFSVGLALNALGANYRFTTPVYRRGSLDVRGSLAGDLTLVAAGDLTLGGRREINGRIAFTNFDHNDANNLNTAILTPQDPLRGLDELARQVRASGIRSVNDVVIDNRLFEKYRVPNGNLLITPILVNENMVDVTATPTQAGKVAHLDWRPKTAAFAVRNALTTAARGQPADISLSHNGLMICNWPAPCTGLVSGTIPIGYKAPLSASPALVRTFRVESPASFAQSRSSKHWTGRAFACALRLRGTNAVRSLPPRGSYSPGTRVAALVSAPYSEYAKLILKVSLNLGANLSLSLFGLTKGQRTIAGALAAERKTLVGTMGIPPKAFDFPTNGSGSPDSRAAPRATVQMLLAMQRGRNGSAYRASLPILGVDGSLAATGRSLPAKGHVFAKTGTTIDQTGLKAQVLAGYIDAKSGRHLAFALYVNDAGPLKNIADVAEVFDDEAQITNVIYEQVP
ncbi:MAG: peptidase S13 [Candidatus Eremiobacter antarcticus]|nr:MAG: peptidase S13 [Candidatus Eremiobacteraeota bacterium]PZR64348.1 MAG: peptidase S13 [Candidatus Eremiobacter sp. RRmetagenome_bin22]